MSFAFVLLFILVHYSVTDASPAVTPGPRQVCTCFPPDTPDVCPVNGSGAKPPKPPASDRLQCEQRRPMSISFIADDTAALFICGRLIGSTSFFGERKDIRYEGGCDDLIFFLTNTERHIGVSVLIEYDGKKYGTTENSRSFRKPRIRPLHGRTAFEPSGAFLTNPPDFDFSSWTPAVVGLHYNARLLRDLASEGAFLIGIQRGSAPLGIYGMRIPLPFCG